MDKGKLRIRFPGSTIDQWNYLTRADTNGEIRRYYLWKGEELLLLVLRNNLSLQDIRGRICDCMWWWDNGTQGFCRHEGVPQRKITVFRILRTPPFIKLEDLLFECPRNE